MLPNFNLGAELKRAGNLAEARACAELAVQANPSWAKGWALLGEVKLAQGEPLAAIAELERAVQLDPFNSTAFFNLGNALIRTRQIGVGTDAYLKAIQLDGKLTSSAFNNLGSALMDANAPEDAEVAFHRALEADPENVQALKNLAEIQFKQKQFKPAEELYRRALKVQVGDTQSLTGLVRTLLAVKELAAAEAEVHAFLSRNPDDLNAIRTLAVIFMEQGKTETAERLFAQILEVAPDDTSILLSFVSFQLHQGNIDAADKIAQQIRDLNGLTPLEAQTLERILEHIQAQRPSAAK